MPTTPRKRPKKSRLSAKKQPSQGRSRATYESILDAAARLLEKHGYAELTTNHVAKAAGVAIGSLYEYFATKDAIVAEVVRRTVRSVASEIAESFQASLAVGMERGLRPLIRAMFAAIETRGRLVRVLSTSVPFLNEIDEVRELPNMMLAIARQGIPGATTSWLKRDPEAATYLLTVMVGAAVVESVAGRPAHLTLAQLEDSLVGLLSRVLVES
ncbi:MAG: TetR/AcrR family transcriptional regulator [Myxococcales bacterium]